MDIEKGLMNRLVEIGDLNRRVKDMFMAAKRASKRAIPTHSGFTVGCSALLRTDEIVSGFNYEIDSRNDAIHGEESMIMKVNSRKTLDSVLVTADCERPISPCGSCRDLLLSFSYDRKMSIFMANNAGQVIPTTLDHLMPRPAYLLREEKALRLNRLKGISQTALKRGLVRDVGEFIWGKDVVRYARLTSQNGLVFEGSTTPRSDYHGVSALEAAFSAALSQRPGSSGRITAAYLVVPHTRSIELPYGCERQCLFELARAQKGNFDVYVISDRSRAIKTDAVSLLPYGFAAEPVINYIRSVILPEKR